MPTKRPNAARVKIRPAGLGELRRNFRDARHDHGHSQSGKNHREWAGSSQEAREFTWQTENPTSDDAVDDQGSSSSAR